MGRDAVDQVLHRADLQKQRLKAQHAAMLEQLKSCAHPLLKSANRQAEASDADSMSAHSQRSSTAISDVSLQAQADVQKRPKGRPTTEIEVGSKRKHTLTMRAAAILTRVLCFVMHCCSGKPL